MASVALAWVRAAFREVVARVASVWPLVTVAPAATSTEATVPETPKFRLAVVVGSTVPVAGTVWVMVPVVTCCCVTVVTMPVVVVDAGRVNHHQANPPAANNTTTTSAMIQRRRVLWRGPPDAGSMA